jgi:hypothetical protein
MSSLVSIASALESNVQNCSTQGCSAKVQSISPKQKTLVNHPEAPDISGIDNLHEFDTEEHGGVV